MSREGDERSQLGSNESGTGLCGTGHEVEHARRERGMLGDESDGVQRSEWCDLTRLGDHGVAGEKRRGDLAAEDGERKVPWTDRRDDTDRDTQQVYDLIADVAGQDLTLEPSIPVGVVSKE